MDDLIAFPTVGEWWLMSLSCGHKQVWDPYGEQFVCSGSIYCNECSADIITHHKYGDYPSRQLRPVRSFTAMEGDHVRQ